jgi:hypothetical protein
LGSEFAIELRIHAVAALIHIEAFTALLTEPCFMLLTIGDGFPVGMVLAFHFFFLFNKSYLRIPHPVRVPFCFIAYFGLTLGKISLHKAPPKETRMPKTTFVEILILIIALLGFLFFLLGLRRLWRGRLISGSLEGLTGLLFITVSLLAGAILVNLLTYDRLTLKPRSPKYASEPYRPSDS